MSLAVTVGCAALAGVAAALLVPGRTGGRPSRRSRPPWPVPVLAVAGAISAFLHGQNLVLVLVAGGAVLGAGQVLSRARSARMAAAREGRVVEICEALAGELRAGQPPQRALDHCAGTWPELGPVAGAGRLGADVAAALRRVARSPGAAGLADLAAAWQVSAGSGAGLAVALSRIASSARHEQATRALVASELASARATAWLVAVLPAVSLTLGAGMGGHPWHFLLGTGPGLGCLAAGVGLVLTGLAWVDRIAARVQHR